jgi:hypothetical protein
MAAGKRCGCGKKMREKLLRQMITYMYDGEILRDIEAAILKRRNDSAILKKIRFCGTKEETRCCSQCVWCCTSSLVLVPFVVVVVVLWCDV